MDIFLDTHASIQLFYGKTVISSDFSVTNMDRLTGTVQLVGGTTR